MAKAGGRLALAAAGLLGVTIAVAFAALVQIATALNEQAARQTASAMETALTTRRILLERILVDNAAWGSAYEHLSLTTDVDWAYARGNLGASLHPDYHVDALLVVDPQDKTTYSVIAGQLSQTSHLDVLQGAGQALIRQARSAPFNATVPVSTYIAGSDAHLLVAAAAFSTAEDSHVTPAPGPASVLIFVDRLDRAELRQIASAHGLSDLRATKSGEPAVQLELPSQFSENAAFAWTPPRPGRALLENTLPWLATSSLLLAICTAFGFRHIRGTARAIEESRHQLIESQARFRDIAEAASDWMWETDARLRIVYVSDRFSVVTGRDKSEILGQPLGDFIEADIQKIIDLWGRKTDGRVADILCAYLDNAGLNRVGRICGKPVRNHDGDITGYRGTVTDITEETEALQEVQRLSRHDPTTGLSNRSRLEAYLDGLTECYGANPIALVCLDLDDFRSLNETRGYKVGDRALAEVAGRLLATAPKDAMIARLGSDEFAIALPVEDEAHADAWCASLLSTLEQPVNGDSDVRLGATAGVALFPRDAGSAGDLLRKADIALVNAKRGKRGGYRFFSEDLNEAVLERALLRADLRTAIVENQFVLHYQPKFDPRSLKPSGVEALIRWVHPVRGMIQPSIFIPAAEESGLIDAIGAWALETACREILPLCDLPVSVNVSPVQVRNQEAFSEAVAHALDTTGLPPSRLELELTENALFDEIVESRELFYSLKAGGIRLSLDDFGTGYSSLGNLRGFPFDRVKLDKLFVSQSECSETARSVARAVLHIGHAFGMVVTAEGVETEQQLEELAECGFDEVQGFLLARPMPVETLSEFLYSSSWAERAAKRQQPEPRHG